MIGAIIGDIVGSRFEFNNINTKNFRLLNNKSHYTDDTIMTLAVADSLLHNKDLHNTMIEYYRKYPYNGYGGHFLYWLNSIKPEPYYSCGNGSAMRISSVAWLAKSEEEVKQLSRQVTEITHNHPEGLKGAEVTAMCIYKALHGATKQEIRDYVTREYPIIKNFKYKNLKKYYGFTELCQYTVPQAIYCFLISHSFIDCLRTTISIGGDCDTTAAISCAIAEAYYGYIPQNLIKRIKRKLPESMLNIIQEISYA